MNEVERQVLRTVALEKLKKAGIDEHTLKRIAKFSAKEFRLHEEIYAIRKEYEYVLKQYNDKIELKQKQLKSTENLILKLLENHNIESYLDWELFKTLL